VRSVVMVLSDTAPPTAAPIALDQQRILSPKGAIAPIVAVPRGLGAPTIKVPSFRSGQFAAGS
jgi:hypothetical protein